MRFSATFDVSTPPGGCLDFRACFDDCKTIGSLKLVHQSSTTLFRPRFEMSQGLKMFDTVQKCEKSTDSPTTSTFIRGSVKSCMYTSIMQDSNIRKLLTDSAQHSVAISKRAYNVSKHAGFISAVWTINIYCAPVVRLRVHFGFCYF